MRVCQQNNSCHTNKLAAAFDSLPARSGIYPIVYVVQSTSLTVVVTGLLHRSMIISSSYILHTRVRFLGYYIYMYIFSAYVPSQSLDA
jgi:hypothetical protein